MTTTTLPPSHDPARILAVIGQHSKARCAARGVLTVLASFARWSGPDAGTCYPSMRRIAELAGVTVRTVQRCIARLIALGEIAVIEKGTGRRNTLYRLAIFEGVKLSWQGRQKRPPNLPESSYTPKSPKSRRSRSSRAYKGARRHATDRPSPDTQAAPSRPPLPSTPPARAGRAKNSLSGVLRDPVASPVKWRALSPSQVEEARAGCDPVQWERLRLSAGLDGVASDDLDAAAAHRWRAGAIMRGVKLVA